MNHRYTIIYKNVELRPLYQNDIENLRNWRNDEKNTKFLRKIPFISSDAQEQWYRKYLANPDEMCFSIYEIHELNRIVGSLSLYNFSNAQAEFGKILIGDEEAHGKKIGVNSIIALLSIAFFQLDLSRVYLHVFNNNKPAKHVYETVGFEIEKTSVVDGMEELLMSISSEKFKMK